jgi:multidrug efflux system membrane fusion protein
MHTLPSRLCLPTRLVVLALALALSACPGEDKNAKKRGAPVTAALVASRTVPVVIKAVGNVEAYATVNVKSQVGGQIARQFVRDGQDVKKGDPLFLIDPRTFEAAVREARAKLERDQALLAKAEEDIRRYTDLKAKGVISQEAFDQTQANVKSLRATISLNKAQLEQAVLQLDYANIRSPITGRAGSILVNEGNVIKANDDRTLLVINQVEPICVAFSVPEARLPEIQRRSQAGPLKVWAFVAGDETTPEAGQLTVIENVVDKATGTIRLKADFPNKAKRLWPGQFVRVVIELSRREGALIVPSQAVQSGVNSQYVFVVKPDMSVEMRTVTVAWISEGETVLEGGVKPGETVVTDGHVQLVPGALVEFKAKPQEPAPKEANATAAPEQAAPEGAPAAPRAAPQPAPAAPQAAAPPKPEPQAAPAPAPSQAAQALSPPDAPAAQGSKQ